MASRHDLALSRTLGSSATGEVYTPPVLAAWVARLLAQSLSVRDGVVLDPACGDGELICAAMEQIPGLTKGRGLDISPMAVEAASGRHKNIQAYVTDAITSEADEDIDAVIMNPPWGSKLSQSAEELAGLGFELAKGQYNSWDIFVEWACKKLPVNTAVAMILPDSFFMTQHGETRALLAKNASIDVIARIGEGWFAGVYRGASVVIFRVGKPPKEQRIKFIHVNASVRNLALAGDLDALTQCESGGSLVEQRNWQASGGAFVLPQGACIAEILERGSSPSWKSWAELFNVGRGVEIGKNGALVRCSSCGTHLPPPRAPRPQCPACLVSPPEWRHTSAISRYRPDTDADGEWRPLIVGEDVKRLQATPSRWIRLGMKGVNYKPLEHYDPPKLLIRKTGLGLQAAVDESRSLTTQVVFHYLPKPVAPDFMMRYVEGVLSSRTMLAIHLSVTGDLEWRSHPYVTPSTLAGLPIPVPVPGEPSWEIAQRIAELTLRESKKDHIVRSKEIDECVAVLLSLTYAEKIALSGVLRQVQDLAVFSDMNISHEPEAAA